MRVVKIPTWVDIKLFKGAYSTMVMMALAFLIFALGSDTTLIERLLTLLIIPGGLLVHLAIRWVVHLIQS